MTTVCKVLNRLTTRLVYFKFSLKYNTTLNNVNLAKTYSTNLFQSVTSCRYNYNLKNISVRYKSKSKKSERKLDSSDDDEIKHEIDEFDEKLVDKTTKIIDTKVNSLRVDIILKYGLGMARNKVEEMFYESRVRVNGNKIFKKSEQVNEKDELDIIRGVDVNNPKFLTVSRVEILSAIPKGEGFSVKLRRCKTLTIENYEQDTWKP